MPFTTEIIIKAQKLLVIVQILGVTAVFFHFDFFHENQNIFEIKIACSKCTQIFNFAGARAFARASDMRAQKYDKCRCVLHFE